MPITEEQITILRNAIIEYGYPRVTFDFNSRIEIHHATMRELEKSVRDALLSDNIADVKNGLSNILFWGYYRQGIRDVRVEQFKSKVSDESLRKAKEVIRNLNRTGLTEIKNLRLPEFSQMSFVSKLRMFLNPTNYVVLDLQLMKLANEEPHNLFAEITRFSTSIPITQENQRRYQAWCDLCKRAAGTYFVDGFIAVDVERGIFQLIQKGQANIAAQIVAILALDI